jgi:hypothetical protein
MLFVRALFLLLISMQICWADPSITLRQLEFKGWFGQQKQGDQSTVYVLLGCGFFFQTPVADGAEKIIADWIAAHPDAKVTIVDRNRMMAEPNAKPTMSYIWVQDGDVNFNLWLVREGLFPAGVMADGVAYLSTLPDIDKNRLPERLVSNAEYEAFFQKAIDAEAMAAKERKGIWGDDYHQRRYEWGLE